jgi:hypothetical protein
MVDQERDLSARQNGEAHISPKLYRERSEWWPLLSAPGDYAEAAEFYRKALISASSIPIRTVFELGSGGGNNASHLKTHFKLTLSDLSSDMLRVSRTLNPECEHIQGDMRSIRLGRLFDAVFVHDAITYMTNETDLRAAITTAWLHCRPGGVILLAPDYTRETFKPSTEHGGHDDARCSLRYLSWTWDPNPEDTTYVVDMVYLLRDDHGKVDVEYDRHVLGLFSQTTWLDLIADIGFEPRSLPFVHSEFEPGSCGVFLGIKPVDVRVVSEPPVIL